MLFTIILVCSLYYLVCFYIGHLVILQGSDWNPKETFIALCMIFALCPIFSPIFVIVRGWNALHRDVEYYENTLK